MLRALGWLAFAAVLVGCGSVGDGEGGTPPGSAGPTIDPRWVELKERVAALGFAQRIETYLAAPLLPDLRVVRPSVDFQQNDALQIVGRVENVGGSDAGPFTLRYQVWLFGPAGRQSGEILREEPWPGVAAGALEESENFLLPQERMLVNLAGWDPPVAIAILMTADPISRQKPRGDVDEINDGGNNIQIYATASSDPSGNTPWIVRHE
jgi:hypothetical protein